jgi:cytochrome P450
LNEFRKFMGLRPYTTFLEWNDDEEIAAAAEALYHDIDNLELYVGMQAEQAKTPQAGAGLCPGFTISRAILSDAVALTRGDRFLTVDCTPQNLTTWGYDDCQAITSDGSFGGMLSRLLFRHLPDYYPTGSTYAHFPFLVPGKMKGFAQKLPGDIDLKYDWNRPAVPVGPPVVATKYSEVQQLLAKPAIFSSGVAQRLDILTGGVPLNRYTTLVGDVLTRQKTLEKATEAFERITKQLIEQKVSKGANPYLDVVREVINLVPVLWLSNNLIGLPLKSAKNPGGVFTEQELYTSFANVANYIYCNKDRSNEWVLREQSQKTVQDVEPFLRGHLARLTRGSVNIEGISDSVLRWVSMRNIHSDDFLRDLVETTGSQLGHSALDGLSGSLLASVVPTAALFSQIIAQVVDFYIDTDKAEQIAQLAKKRANTQIMPFIFEALRLNPPLSSVLLKAQSSAEFAGTVVAERQQVLASIIDATRDASTFRDPETPDYARSPVDTERVLGLDRRGLLSPKLFEQVAPVVLGQIFNLKNLRRYPPQSGPMARCTERIHSVPEKFYTDLNGRVTPFPVSFLVQFDT